MLAAAAGLAASAAAQDVQSGIQAWQSGRYDEAVREWRPLADRGDADAQFNLGHAYRLGRGVPQNMNLAEQWYERAARAGHVEAQAMYGLILFQNGRRDEAMPYVRQAAERGDARAQYVYGTALFNGDVVERDWPRAWAFMTLAARQDFPPAQSHLREMEAHVAEADRARGDELARAIEEQAPTRIVEMQMPAAAPTPRIAETQLPPSAPARRPEPAATQRPPPATLAGAGGWRIQLGAFSSEANARRAWSSVSGRLAGLQPYFVRAGAMVRLQAGPLASRAAATQACAAARQACFPVAP